MYFPSTAGNAGVSTGLGWWSWALQTPAQIWGEGREGAEQELNRCHFIVRCIYAISNMGNGQDKSGWSVRKGKKRMSWGKLHQMLQVPLAFLRKPVSWHEHTPAGEVALALLPPWDHDRTSVKPWSYGKVDTAHLTVPSQRGAWAWLQVGIRTPLECWIYFSARK